MKLPPEGLSITSPENVGSEIISLPHDLTDDETLAAGAELAQAIQDIAHEEEVQKEKKAEMKTRLTDLEANRSRLVTKVSRREEYRPTECDLQILPTGMVQIIRKDTGEVVRERAAYDSELQRFLPETDNVVPLKEAPKDEDD